MLFLASWRDRPKCKDVAQQRSLARNDDDPGCSPPSWRPGPAPSRRGRACQEPARAAHVARRGEPPQRSPCGGRAPYTALQWALRKSGVATSWPEKERFGAVMELVEEAIFVPLAGEERIGGGFVVG